MRMHAWKTVSLAGISLRVEVIERQHSWFCRPAGTALPFELVVFHLGNVTIIFFPLPLMSESILSQVL